MLRHCLNSTTIPTCLHWKLDVICLLYDIGKCKMLYVPKPLRRRRRLCIHSIFRCRKDPFLNERVFLWTNEKWNLVVGRTSQILPNKEIKDRQFYWSCYGVYMRKQGKLVSLPNQNVKSFSSSPAIWYVSHINNCHSLNIFSHLSLQGKKGKCCVGQLWPLETITQLREWDLLKKLGKNSRKEKREDNLGICLW